MAEIEVERIRTDGQTERRHVDDLEALREVLQAWASTWDWRGTRINSSTVEDVALVAALPRDLDTETGACPDELYDEIRDDLELPLSEEAGLEGSVIVNGRRWVLVQERWSPATWIPNRLWDYPLRTIYEVATWSERGAQRYVRVYQAGDSTVTITGRDHFNSRVGGYEEVELGPEPTQVGSYEEVVDDPDLPDDDPLSSIELKIPTLVPGEAGALAQRLAARYGPRASICVNDITIDAVDEDD